MYGLLTGRETLLVGLEDQDDGGLRLYVGHRADGRYAVVYDEDAKREARIAWARGQHVTIPTPPPDAIYVDTPGQERP